MGKCCVCGKSGMFIFVNTDGMCKVCAKDFEEKKALEKQKALEKKQEEISSAQKYFGQIVHLYSEIVSLIEADSDPIQQLECIPQIEQKINTCQQFYSLLDSYTSYKYLDEIIMQNITYDTEDDQRINLGHIKSLSLTVWTGKSYSQSKIFCSLKETATKYEKGWRKEILRITQNAEFQKVLLSLENYNFEFSDKKIAKRNLYEMPELKISNITSKTSYERTGTFVVIDTETTGLNCSQHEIIEVAAIYFHNWIPVKKFETFLKPKKEIPLQITELTHITNDMVKDSPTFSQIVPGLLSFIGNYNIVAHNLLFDLDFLYKNGLDFFSEKRKYYDTLKLAQKTLRKSSKKWDKDLGTYEINYDKDYDVENYKLNTLCDFYEIRDNKSSHRALSDCLATGFLFQKLVAKRTGTIISQVVSNTSTSELLYTKWGVYEMPDPYYINFTKGPRKNLKAVQI